MKKQLVIMGIVAQLLTTWLSGCQSQGIRVEKISGEHPNSVNMTEKQMNNFPHLKETILTNTSGGDIPKDEWDELKGILLFFDTDIIQYQNEYYEITFNVAD
jgi:hypothetical protein